MNNIRKAREELGLSQKEVAIALKVSAPTVSEWESGKKYPSAENLIELSKFLKVSMDYLLCQDERLEEPDDFSFLDDLTEDEIVDRCFKDFKVLFSLSAKTTKEQLKGAYIDLYKRFNN